MIVENRIPLRGKEVDGSICELGQGKCFDR